MALSTFVDTDDFVQTRAEWRGCLAEKVYCRGFGKQENAGGLKKQGIMRGVMKIGE